MFGWRKSWIEFLKSWEGENKGGFMPKWLGVVVQLILLAGQMVNLLGGFVPTDVKWIVLAIIGGLQVVAQAVQSHYNPDGTLATVAYRK